MTDAFEPAWEPHSDPDAGSLIEEGDAMRRKCPVAHGGPGKWYVFGHREVTSVLLDHETFSNVVSGRLSVPNGMDPPQHTAYRQLVEPLFSREYLDQFEPACRAIAVALIERAKEEAEVEVMGTMAYPFAGRTQCAFLGWSDALSALFEDWTRRNQEAIRLGDREKLNALAAEFEAVVDDVLRHFRRNGAPRGGVMEALLDARVQDRPLSDAELASLFRNWTVGEIGTIAAAIGILLHAMASHPDLQRTLRAQPERLPTAIDEILRVHGPLVSNRRRATRDTTIAGCPIHAGDEVNVLWVSANRDEAIFERPGEILPDRDQHANLLYGAGIHVCPGAPLARLEMRVFMEECLRRCGDIRLPASGQAEYARHPASGYQRLELQFA